MDRLERLGDTRDRIEAAIAACESARDLPALSREYRLLCAEIDALQPRAEVDGVDEITRRRAAKRAARTEAETRADGVV